ncbi:hypothetical protein ACHAWC_005997 [Mediolabrus comicus]
MTSSSSSSAVPKIKAAIFDLDGTLLDTESLSCRAVIDSFELTKAPLQPHIRSNLKQNGDLLPWELKRQILGLRGTEWVPMVLGYAQEKWGWQGYQVGETELDWREGWQSRNQTIDSQEMSEMRGTIISTFIETWERRLGELCEEVVACPGAPELVQALFQHDNIALAIATSSRSAGVQKKRIKHEEMFKSFDHIVTGDDENVRKVPDKRMEKEDFLKNSDHVIPSMWHFDGHKWGVNVDMSKHNNTP